jgi:glycosyltransferase involved in cell wall biosynthesis
MSERYEFVPLHQEGANGGINVALMKEWSVRLRKIRPDLVHVRGLGNEGFHGVLAARIAGCPRILVSIHGTQRDLSGPETLRRKIVVKGLEPLTLRMATHVTTVCEYAAQRPFVQRHRAKFVGPLVNGITLPDDDRADRAMVRAGWQAKDDDIVLISVGRLSSEKGHVDLALALRSLDQTLLSRMVLVVVGDGPDDAAIEAGYRIEGLRVRVLGRRLDVPTLLAAADVFVFPSWHENLSNALIEAMAAGLPVIASRVGGNTEVVNRGGGCLVDAHDPRQLAAVITQMAADDDLRRQLGRQAEQVARAHYSTDAMVRSVERVYSQIFGTAQ